MKTIASALAAIKLTTLAGYAGVGLVVGAMSGMLGVGGGFLMVPAINLLWGQPMQVAVGTSLAAMIPTAIAGFAKHQFSYHNVDLVLAGMLALGAMAGSYCVGAPLAEYLPGDTLKRVFGVTLVIFGIYYVWFEPWVKSMGPQP